MEKKCTNWGTLRSCHDLLHAQRFSIPVYTIKQLFLRINFRRLPKKNSKVLNIFIFISYICEVK